MATLLLSAAGAAIGAGFGGTVLGLSGAVIGRAVGATLGRVIDQRIMGAGSQAVETGRVDRFRLMGASEGSAVPLVWGRTRVAGQVIWSTAFQETVTTRGGKGTPQPKVREFGYTVSLALALCEGEITRIGRVWADGQEIEKGQLSLRVYTGSETQMPDPKISAVEGVEKAPAYRGTAYVVIEDLDLSRFGNRVPQFNFEVMRRAKSSGRPQVDLAASIPGVALIPGTGEYSLATTRVHFSEGLGVNRSANVNSASGKTDLQTSLEQLSEELPNAEAMSIVVSWFGNDLRCGNCLVKPKVEQTQFDGVGMPWRAGGIGRSAAELVPMDSGRPVYGGTPADAAVIEAIRAANQAGKQVMFYPFILMEQLEGNLLPNPWTGAVGQPILPWRGRITTEVAPGQAGTTDRTAAAAAEVAAFMGTAQVSDFSVASGQVSYEGPAEWRYRRFILHYAHLCALAGGVEAFCIGSEMVGATTVRDANDDFPFVAALVDLAADVRAILGPQVKISYAADWSEYFGVHRDGNVYFHLDPLWSDANIDFIGIDNYMPLTDWRDGEAQLDKDFGSIYNLDYLGAGIAGGEGFDWYYDGEEGRASQIRLPIEDGAHSEPWVFRYKDLKGWWSNAHFNRIGGSRSLTATGWVPSSKPIRFTEYGCAAIDKATNQPNKFLDPKSAESALPFFSDGNRDDFIQHQYYLAQATHWAQSQNNPASSLYAGRMLDFSRCYAWAWDARPYPAFPANTSLWSDGSNYGAGHWLNGRVTGQPLSEVVHEICSRASVAEADASDLTRIVRGYAIGDIATARAGLQPLSLVFDFDAVENDGQLRFEHRSRQVSRDLTSLDLAVGDEGATEPVLSRASAPEMAGHVQLGFIDDRDAYQLRYADALMPDETSRIVSQSETNIVMQSAEAREVAENWLTQARVARDTIEMALPPSLSDLGAGAVVKVGDLHYRIDRVERREAVKVDAVRTIISSDRANTVNEVDSAFRPFLPPLPVFTAFLDVPLLQEADQAHAPYVAAAASPWQGDVGVWRSVDGNDFTVDTILQATASVGVTQSALQSHQAGVWDTGDALIVKMSTGLGLQSITDAQLLAGGNTIAIGDGSPGNWEVLQFRDAALVAPQTYSLTRRLRGQLGTDGIMPQVWPAGSQIIVLDRTIRQMSIPSGLRGVSLQLRSGAASRGPDDISASTQEIVATGAGLRPYPIAHLTAVSALNGDLTVHWQRRTRVNGDSWDVFEVPLAEETELYQVEVWHSGSLLRQSFVATPNFIYTVADRIADEATGLFEVRVAQVSQVYGAGPYRSIALIG
jgi:hypothetical protein